MSLCDEKEFKNVESCVSFMYCTNITEMDDPTKLQEKMTKFNKNMAKYLNFGDLIRYEICNLKTEKVSILFIPLQKPCFEYNHSLLIQKVFDKYKHEIGSLEGEGYVQIESLFHKNMNHLFPDTNWKQNKMYGIRIS